MTWPSVFLGTLIEAVGLGLLGWAIYAERLTAIYVMMALVGLGSGLRFMASPLHGIGLYRDLRASVIGLLAVAIPFGGTLGLTVMSTVFNNTSGLDANDGDFSKIQSQPAGVRDKAVHDAKMGVVWAFVAVTPLAAMVGFLRVPMNFFHDTDLLSLNRPSCSPRVSATSSSTRAQSVRTASRRIW